MFPEKENIHSFDSHKPYSVLVIDDDSDQLEILNHALSHHGFEVHTMDTGENCMERILSLYPDIILLDILLPKINGFEILGLIRKNPKTRVIPVLLISALTDTDHIIQGLKEGANDYITKPINTSVLLARMQTHLRITFLVKRQEMQMQILSKMAAIDELTGIYNRRTLFRILDMEIKRSHRYSHDLSLFMMDIDLFKKINDKYGHAVGDQVLVEFAKKANRLLRSNDILCRYGGEEFCTILPETDHESAMIVAKRICHSIHQTKFLKKLHNISLTVSIGTATLCSTDLKSAKQILELADKAMYEAKKQGRNCVACIDSNETESIKIKNRNLQNEGTS